MRTKIIHFRSSLIGKHTGSGISYSLRAQGGEIDTIRPTTGNDDVRDIAWKQTARTGNIVVKSRIDTPNLRILIARIEDGSWDFQTHESDRTKHVFYDALRDASELTAHFSHFSFSEKSGNSVSGFSEYCREEKIRDTLIILITSSLDTEEYGALGNIAQSNDIILLHILHPYECTPSAYSKVLIKSKEAGVLYEKVIQEKLHSIESACRENGIAPILCQNSDDPILLLNFFFKHRYARS